MSALTYLVQAEVEASITTIEGKTLTRPELVYTDGLTVTYGVNVDIGREGPINENGDIGLLPLINVPIAPSAHNVIYADVGTPVMLSRSATGQWQVVGFAKTFPNVFTIIPVTVPQYPLTIPLENVPGDPVLHEPIIGTPIEIGQEVRPLTYEEIGTLGTYGETCYGAVGVFVGGVLTQIQC